ncbi:MAG: HNH endonuclease [Burkholderiaceae bacterium]|nr:HNH endonuclease [Burkholderiaceae bacterium]
MAKTRYYVHGDRRHGGDEYYCACCDAFEPWDHFSAAHTLEKRARRYVSSMAEWAVLDRAQWKRPMKVENTEARSVQNHLRAQKDERGEGRRRLSPRTRFAIFRRDWYRCRLCGAAASDGARLEVDHIHPVARGGTNAEGNLWTLCWECNSGKSDRLLCDEPEAA